MPDEVVLGSLPTADESERLLVVMKSSCGGLALCQQSFSPSVGWFTQKTLELAPEQVRQLRGVLGTASARAPRPTTLAMSTEPLVDERPTISLNEYRAESA